MIRICGFCGKRNTEVKMMMAGIVTCICNECICVCADGLAQFTRKKDEDPTATCIKQPEEQAE